MNNKKCPQCKNLISISAPTCLYCGRPNKFITKEYINKKWRKENNINRFGVISFFSIKYLLIISFFIIVILIIRFN